MSRLARVIALAATLAGLGVGGAAFAGCGDDDEGAGLYRATTTEATEATTGTTTTEPAQTTEEGQAPTEQSGGTRAPEDTYDPEQDTEEHDIPPPKGSPAEKFEQYCEQYPEACD